MAGSRGQKLLLRGSVLALACALGFAAPSACSNSEDAPLARRPMAEAGPFEASPEPASPASAGAAGSSDTPSEGGADLGVAAPVRLGIAPLTDASEGGADSDSTLAELTVLSAGSRARSLSVRFDQLLDASGNPSDSVFAGLAQTAALYRAHSAALLFSIAIVDRTEDARPPALRASWSSTQLRSAIRAVVDRVYVTFGQELAYLSFGTDVDRFLSLAGPNERLSAAAFMYQALNYAKAHAQRLPSTQVGVTFSAPGVIAGLPPEANALLLGSDAAIITDYALDASFQAKSLTDALADLATLDSTLKDQPIVLQELAYPSSPLVQSSPEQQEQFYDHVFALLAARRQRFPFVDIYALTDDTDADALQRALTFGMLTGGSDAGGNANANADASASAELSAATAAFSSFGLTAREPNVPGAQGAPNTTAKPAWLSALRALSEFESP
ncbi:MAG TPA: hypothetical protein VGF76_04810 [Polyangiaceae bacterium]